uniref:BHLH domain-containing protein n=1 Tax=Globodera rostochiensis TaxID=31243 RepID=A0A914I5E0_GLORO
MNTNDTSAAALIGVHHHQSPQMLSIEQFLRAAKLIEQQRANEHHRLLINQPTPPAADPAMLSLLDVAGGGLLAKLGEEYQERLLLCKMRSGAGGIGYGDVATTAAAPNSTGSSRRSSPLSAETSPCSPSSTQRFCNVSSPTTSSGNHGINNNNGRSSSCNATTPPATSSSRGGGSRGASRQSRAAHNELEKNRRANLRGHLEALKAALPPEAETQRDTTLSLLTRARNHIRTIKEQKAELLAKRKALLAEHLHLQGLQQPLPMPNSSNSTTSAVVVPQQEMLSDVVEFPDPLPMPKAMFMESARPAAPPTAATEAADADRLLKKTSMAARDLLEMQGLVPLLPQLYPYRHPSTTAAKLLQQL